MADYQLGCVHCDHFVIATDSRDADLLMAWVARDGSVSLQPIPLGMAPVGWAEQNADRIRFRYETFVCGGGYTGSEAAVDDQFVNDWFEDLMADWQNGRTGFVDFPGAI